ncbi:MAG: succinate dehydrogenase flavoprotein subunit [Deltaproteobacteria bacterium]|nr:succinate dehydrogenase flavoprotein subunit [Deltaproteobacteria bacterium]
MAETKIIIVGGGLAGLMTTIKAVEAGAMVDIFSIVPVKRSHSVCAQGGINASVNTKGEGDSPQIHFEETIYGGDFLGNQLPVKGMCEASPNIVYLLDRMGVPFNRTPEGNLDFRRFGGSRYHRTAFAGATTGQQLLYALDEQVRRFEAEGKVKKYEGWEFLSILKDGKGSCCGIVALDLIRMEIHPFLAGAVVLATGGPGLIFGKTTNSLTNTGGAAGSVYQEGAIYANGEFIQVHPTAISGGDKLRLISESVRGEGGRVWTLKDGKRWYFLEEWYPAYGNLVPRDIASRAIYKVCRELGLGIDGKDQVYLDVTHIDKKRLRERLGGVLEIYEKFMGESPYEVPMKVFPAVHYSMGGLWVDFDQMTNISGLFAAGECEYQYHGANRLGANSLLSCIYGGMIAGPKSVEFVKSKAGSITSSEVDSQVLEQKQTIEEIYNMQGVENPHRLHQELSEMMTSHVTIVRENKKIEVVCGKIRDLMVRYQKIGLSDTNRWANGEVLFTRQLWNMLVLAELITLGALQRDESRGAHYKPGFPDRNDEEWLKTTKATYTSQGPRLEYEAVDIQYLKPRPRRYDQATAGVKK